jgi:hypothetical protein
VDDAPALIAYGVAVDGMTSRVAAVYGPESPALVVYTRRDDALVPTVSVSLDHNPAAPVTLSFVAGGQRILVQDGPRLRLVSAEDGSEITRGVNGRVVRIVEAGADRSMFAVLTRGDTPDPGRGFRTPGTLLLMDHAGVQPITTGYAANEAELRSVSGLTYVQHDGSAVAFSVGLE